ncbi:MAG: hypothetical protein HQK49_11400 [Oligoflexia bacterium]|nr:hypothetical protein [Oligoflexia bacterium]
MKYIKFIEQMDSTKTFIAPLLFIVFTLQLLIYNNVSANEMTKRNLKCMKILNDSYTYHNSMPSEYNDHINTLTFKSQKKQGLITNVVVDVIGALLFTPLLTINPMLYHEQIMVKKYERARDLLHDALYMDVSKINYSSQLWKMWDAMENERVEQDKASIKIEDLQLAIRSIDFCQELFDINVSEVSSTIDDISELMTRKNLKWNVMRDNLQQVVSDLKSNNTIDPLKVNSEVEGVCNSSKYQPLHTDIVKDQLATLEQLKVRKVEKRKNKAKRLAKKDKSKDKSKQELLLDDDSSLSME